MGDEREAERERMVAGQLVPRGIRAAQVLEAMRKVPRHRFVPANLQDHAYDDGPLPIGEGQTISQPYIVALMTELSRPAPLAKVLEIGTGSGYAASVLSRICKEVYTVERLPHLSEQASERIQSLGYANVHCIVGDGTLGLPEHAPYDSILVTAGAPAVPDSLKKQLAIGGTMVIPVGDSVMQKLLCVRRLGPEDYHQEVVEAVRFVPLIGEEGW